MKQLNWLLWLTAVLVWLVGCGTVAEPAFAPEPNTEIELTEVGAQLPTAVSTSLPPEATVTMTPLPTLTPVPPQNTATPEPTIPSSLFLPSSEGKLIFTQISGFKPAPENMGLRDDFSLHLYVAQPGVLPNVWPIDIMLTDIVRSEPTFSPDQTKLAILLSNSDVVVIDLETNTLTNITIEAYVFNIYWLDNDTLITKERSNLLTVFSDGTGQTALTNNPTQLVKDELYHRILSIRGAPNGRFVAVSRRPEMGLGDTRSLPTGNIELLVYDMEKSSMVPILDERGVDFVMEWSPDSQYLAVTPDRSVDQLKILNSETFAIERFGMNPSVDNRRLTGVPAWSDDSQWLAFVVEKEALWFWDGASFFAYMPENNSIIFNTQPSWLPQENRVAVSFSESEGEQSGWLVIDPVSMMSQTYYTDGQPNEPAIWSPDGNWLLFYALQNNKNGYFALNIQNGETFSVYDATSLWEFGGLTWLPNPP